jgi:hypothetical protein
VCAVIVDDASHGRPQHVAGRWSDFLIWVGAAAIFGWGIAALFNVRWRRRGENSN